MPRPHTPVNAPTVTAEGDWLAPRAEHPVDATVTLPGSKSLTNRYLVLAALANGTSRLRRPLRSRDTLLMAQALRSLGAGVEDLPGDDPEAADWLVTPATLRGDSTVDCGLAGTVMRFLPPVATLAAGRVAFDGDAHARNRPMAPVVDALRALGAQVEDDGRGRLPFTVRRLGEPRRRRRDPRRLGQLAVHLRAAAGGRTVRAGRRRAPRRQAGPQRAAHPDDRGGAARRRGGGRRQRGQHLAGRAPEVNALDVQVEPDLSNAAPFLAAALVTDGSVRVPGWPQHTTQAGDAIRDIFDAMGAEVSLDRAGLTVSGTGQLSGLDVDLHDVGELTPVVAALAALADSPSRLRGIAHLRGHETDRLSALAHEINALGGDVVETEDGLRITPRTAARWARSAPTTTTGWRWRGRCWGCGCPDLVVENVETTAKTLPGFTERWTQMLSGAGDGTGRGSADAAGGA